MSGEKASSYLVMNWSLRMIIVSRDVAALRHTLALCLLLHNTNILKRVKMYSSKKN